jgi:hypothetical protein
MATSAAAVSATAACALAHHVRGETVAAGDRQHERQQREQTEQQRLEVPSASSAGANASLTMATGSLVDGRRS